MDFNTKETFSEIYEIFERKPGSKKWKHHVKFWQMWKVFYYATLEAAKEDLEKIQKLNPKMEYAIHHQIFKQTTEIGNELI